MLAYIKAYCLEQRPQVIAFIHIYLLARFKLLTTMLLEVRS